MGGETFGGGFLGESGAVGGGKEGILGWMDRRGWPGVLFGVSGSPTGIGPLTFFGVSGSPTGIGPLTFWAGAGDEDGVTYGESETSLPVFTGAESKKRFKNQ